MNVQDTISENVRARLKKRVRDAGCGQIFPVLNRVRCVEECQPPVWVVAVLHGADELPNRVGRADSAKDCDRRLRGERGVRIENHGAQVFSRTVRSLSQRDKGLQSTLCKRPPPQAQLMNAYEWRKPHDHFRQDRSRNPNSLAG